MLSVACPLIERVLSLSRDLLLVSLLLGDIAAFACEKHHIAVIVLHRHHRGVDDDRLRPAC
jgi:hypothetical protein